MKENIVEDFIEFVKIPSNSKKERKIFDVLATRLKGMGFSVVEDKCGEIINGEAGNLIAFLPGDTSIPALLFSAHLDRVPNHGNIRPLIEEGQIKSDGTSILGADDVSGICAIIDGIRRVQAEKISHGPLEIVFSVAEEIGLLGARYLDYSKISSKMAYVIDTGGPVGTVINQCPSQYTMEVEIIGRSAHAGIEPEKGLNAITVAAKAISRLRQGRLSASCTSNIGLINGGIATNIVCDKVLIKAEARSTIPQELDEYLIEFEQTFNSVAEECGAKISIKKNLEYSSFKVDEGEKIISLARRAMDNIGLEMKVMAGGGGMDGNYFNQHGLKAVGLSPGFQKVHTPEESQTVDELIKCGQIIYEIIKESLNLK